MRLRLTLDIMREPKQAAPMERESATDALVEQSGPVQNPEMQIGFSRNTEDWESRR